MKTHKLCAAIISLGFLVLGSGAARASGFGLNENSARVMGMAGAFTGIADTPAAGFWNPAGLANQTGFGAEAGLTFITPGVQYTGIAPETGNEATVDAVRNYFYIPAVHSAFRIHDRVAAGLSFYVPYGLTSEWPGTVTIDGKETAWWGRGAVRKIALQTFYFNPNVAIKLHDRIFIGGGFVVALGTVELQRPVTMSNDVTDDIDLDLAGDDIGFGGTAGVLVKVLPELLHVGVTYRSGVSFNFEGKAAFTKNGSADNIPLGLRTRLTDGRGSAALDLPHVISFGVGAFPTRDLTVGFNFDVITWSSYEKLEIKFADNPELDTAEPKNWRNTVVIRLGAEYHILPKLPVRAGFIFDQGPPPSETLGPELPDGDRYEFCLGVGYGFKGFYVDAAYMYLLTGDVESSEGAPLLGTYRSDAHLASVSLGYHLDW